MSRDQLSDDEIVAMTHSYDLTPGGEYITHLAYQEINRQCATGRQWAKCPNCGNPYPLDKPGASSDVCSDTCFQQYTEYLYNEAGF
jgi:rubredoxin